MSVQEHPPELVAKRGGLTPAGIVLLAGTIVVSAVTAVSAFWASWQPGAKDWWPFVVLAISVGLIIALISVARLHAFVALVLAALSAGLMSRIGSLPGEAEGKSHWLQSIELTAGELGRIAGGIGIVIALAAIIGMCLLESGAADKIVRRFLAVFGEKRAGLALLISTYIVSIPIFFDTIFMLLLPIAKALRLRTGKDYLLYLMAICCAGVITHSMAIPHPGPLQMAINLNVDAGLSIVMGLMSGLLPLAAGWMFCHWINRRMEVQMSQTGGASQAELERVMDRPESELPSLGMSLLPVLLPVVLIWAGSFADTFWKKEHASLAALGGFIGNRNIALMIGTVLSVWILMRQKGLTLANIGQLIDGPLQTAGVIILITAAGGAFGLMLKNAGVGDAIKNAAGGYDLNLIVLSYVVAVVIRVAQGSATVAMLTTSAMVYPLMQASSLPYHPVYIFLAIGYGAMICSWMNDSGFWVISKLSGMTEKQTLRSWTILVTVVSITGLLTTLLLSRLLPMVSTGR